MCFHYFFSFPINSPSSSGFLPQQGYIHISSPSLSLSLSLFCMHMHALTAKAYKQYLHVVLDLHNHTFVTSSTKHSMAIQFPTKISILFFFLGGGGKHLTLFLLLEMIFDFHNATLCPSFSAFFLYNPLDVGVPQESDTHLQPKLSIYTESGLETESHNQWPTNSLYLYVNRYQIQFSFSTPLTQNLLVFLSIVDVYI